MQKFAFKFRSGKKYALVGDSGCGKSTLTALLCRFYEPETGSIHVGNVNIKEANIHALKQRIALVTQDNQLFHDSIQANIRYGELACTETEMVHAAVQAGIATHIDCLPVSIHASEIVEAGCREDSSNGLR